MPARTPHRPASASLVVTLATTPLWALRAPWALWALGALGAASPCAADEVPPGAPPANFVAPRLLRFAEATPPPALATRGHAEVVLAIDVDVAGHVVKVAVVEPAGDGFDEAAVEAARRFEFAPGTADGVPVPVQITYRYRFFQRAREPGSAQPPAGEPPAGDTPAGGAPPPPGPGGAVDRGPMAPLAGVVISRGDRVALAGATVTLDEDGALAATTGPDGGFAFDAVPVGAHTIHVRGNVEGAPDYPVTLRANVRSTVTLWVVRKERYRSVVRGTRPVVEVVEQTLTAEEVKRIPGTQGDTIKAVQNLAGVARPPFGGGALVVWGSAPRETRAYVDGVYIPLLFHFSGLRSTVNAEVVDALTFMPGGYGVEYGRGLGGAIEVQGRRPRADGYHGFAQIDVIDVSAMVEGPIAKNLTFLVGARYSLLQFFLPYVLPSDNVNASPKYWDYQARLHYRAGPRDDLELFAFGSDDKLELVLKEPNPTLSKAFDTHMFYHRGLVRWTHRFDGGATVAVTPSIGWDLPYNVGSDYGGLPFKSQFGQLQYNLRAVARVPLGAYVRLDAGVDFEGSRFNLDSRQNLSGLVREGDMGGFGGLGGPDTAAAVASDRMRLFTNHAAPFARLQLALLRGRLVVGGQVRLEVLSFHGYPGEANEFTSAFFRVEPRLSVRAQLHDRVALTAAVGAYHQPPDPADLSAVFGSTKLRPSSALHYVFGVEVKATPTLHVEAQGFYKDLRDLVVRTDRLGTDPLVNDGVGRVYGAQILIRQEMWKNFFGWIVYTVSRSERRDHPGEDDRLFAYDQTHILTVVASYKLPLGFQAGLRFRYATGNPYTPPAGAYFDVNSDGYQPTWGAPYSARMPAFHQLDVRVDKVFTFDRWRLALYLDLQNAYYAKSAETAVWSYDFKKTSYVTGIPLIPALGVRGEF